jgi:hypothetical protein
VSGKTNRWEDPKMLAVRSHCSLFSAGWLYYVLGRSPGFEDWLSHEPIHLPRLPTEWRPNQCSSIYSGGTAPVFHRTSQLSP